MVEAASGAAVAAAFSKQVLAIEMLIQITPSCVIESSERKYKKKILTYKIFTFHPVLRSVRCPARRWA